MIEEITDKIVPHQRDQRHISMRIKIYLLKEYRIGVNYSLQRSPDN